MVTIDIWAFYPPWHQGLYLGVEETGVKCLYVDICYKSLANQALLKGAKEVNITGPYTANQTGNWLWHYSWEVKDFISNSPGLALDVFYLFAPHMKLQDGKWFVTDTSVK